MILFHWFCENEKRANTAVHWSRQPWRFQVGALTPAK